MTADCRLQGGIPYLSLSLELCVWFVTQGTRGTLSYQSKPRSGSLCDWSTRWESRGHKSWAWSAWRRESCGKGALICCLMRTCQDHRSVLSSEMPHTSWSMGNPEPVKKQNFSVRERVLKIFEESMSCGDIPTLTGWIFKQSDITGPTLSSSEWPLEVPCLFTYMESLLSTSLLDLVWLCNDKCIMKKPVPRSSFVFVVIARWPGWKLSL